MSGYEASILSNQQTKEVRRNLELGLGERNHARMEGWIEPILPGDGTMALRKITP